jgi:hypothetical protein
MLLSRLGLAIMTLVGSSLFFTTSSVPAVAVSSGARLAIYYGYPSLVNGANGDVEKAANTFSLYDVVILGDGLEFSDKQSGRYPPGDPEEHEKALKIIAAVQARGSRTRFYGYVCLGEIPSSKEQTMALTPEELGERVNLWKRMGVAGIFLDEAGYDFAVVTRARQNMAVRIIHELGLSAFMNAYFPDHLFSLENNLPYASGSAKNPEHLPPFLDRRDLFLLESFQVKNGTYESVSAWRPRLNLALEYRRRYGAHIFATTTTTEQEPFSAEKFSYAWWTALLYGVDGFGWGEPSFASQSNTLPDHRCRLDSTKLPAFEPSTAVSSDNTRFWKKGGKYLVVVDTVAHSVHRVRVDGSVDPQNVEALLASPRGGSILTCGGSV